MYIIDIHNTKTNTIERITAITVDEAIEDVGNYFAQLATLHTKNYLSQAEVTAIVECLDYAAKQIESSAGDVQVFSVYNQVAGETDPNDQLLMVDVVKDLANKLSSFIDHENSSAIIIE